LKKVRTNIISNDFLDNKVSINHKLEMKRGRSNKRTLGHSNPNSHQHAQDVVRNQALHAKKKQGKWTYVEEVSEPPPAFGVDLSKELGKGICYQVADNGELVAQGGAEWEAEMEALMKELSWYHGPGNKKERIKTRVRDEEGKVIARYPASDVLRETIELRPDHSLAIQMMVRSGRKSEAVELLAEARRLKVELFEKLFHRKVLGVAQHNDSKHLHDDLWHTGITITDENISKQKNVERFRRDRVPFNIYGVGTGTIAWNRHLEVMRQSGMNEEEIKDLTREIPGIVESNIGNAHKELRDLKLYNGLDEFFARRLGEIAPSEARRARAEYLNFLKRGYENKTLGYQPPPTKALEAEKTEIEQKLEAMESERDRSTERSKELRLERDALKELVATLEAKVCEKDAEIDKQVKDIDFLLKESEREKSAKEKAVSLVDELVKAKEAAEAELAKERTLRERAEKALSDLKATVKSLLQGLGHHFANALQLVPSMKSKAKELATEVEMTLPKAKKEDPTRPGNI
jgi:hypothetical protein